MEGLVHDVEDDRQRVEGRDIAMLETIWHFLDNGAALLIGVVFIALSVWRAIYD